MEYNVFTIFNEFGLEQEICSLFGAVLRNISVARSVWYGGGAI